MFAGAVSRSSTGDEGNKHNNASNNSHVDWIKDDELESWEVGEEGLVRKSIGAIADSHRNKDTNNRAPEAK